MMRNEFLLIYNWTEDGTSEICWKPEVILLEEHLCYHCDQPMLAGHKATFLKVLEDGEEYLLHQECAKNSCSVVVW